MASYIIYFVYRSVDCRMLLFLLVLADFVVHTTQSTISNNNGYVMPVKIK